MTRISNTDYIAHIADLSAMPAQSLLLDLLVEPQALPTLWKMAAAFQRIKWLKLHFELVPQVPTSTSGGLIVAPLADPSEVLPGQGLVQYLTSQSGSKAIKAYQATTVSLPCKPEWLYTGGGQNPRFRSPGRLIIATDGKVNQQGGATLTCSWTVELKTPGQSIEEAREDDHRVVIGNAAIWVNGTLSVWSDEPSGTPLPPPRWKEYLPGLKFDIPYRMSVPYLYVGVGDGGKSWNYRYMTFKENGTISLSQLPSGPWDAAEFKHDNIVLTHNDVLTEATLPRQVGECEASSSDQQLMSRLKSDTDMMNCFKRFMLSQSK